MLRNVKWHKISGIAIPGTKKIFIWLILQEGSIFFKVVKATPDWSNFQVENIVLSGWSFEDVI